MKRPVIIGVIGVIVLAIALALNVLTNRKDKADLTVETAPSVVQGDAAPASPPPPPPPVSAEPPRPVVPQVTATVSEPVTPSGTVSPTPQTPATPAPTPALAAAPPPTPAPTPAPAALPAPAPTEPARPAENTPPAPTIIRPSFDVVRVNPRGEAVIAGRAAPDAVVTVWDNGAAIGTVTADRRGEWVLLPSQPLHPGTRELTLTAERPGEGVVMAEKIVVLIVPATPEAAPAPGALAVLVPDRDAGHSTPLQVPQAPTPPDNARRKVAPVTIDVVDYAENGQVSLAGHGETGSIVRFYIDNLWVGEARVGAQGQWRGQPDRPVEPGLYTLRIDQLDEGNRVTARVETPFQRSVVTPDMFKDGNRLVVQPGNSLWRISRRTYGAGIHYTVIYQANRDQIRDPDLIYPGQVFQLPR